jgi:HAD superfamily hydrolase (TIGR01490 family)
LSSSTFSPRAAKFLQSILAKKPAIAVFDCDGTLWSGDSGMDFFYWEIEQGLVSREAADSALGRYDLYKAGTVDELTICGEMVQIHRGVREAEIRLAAKRFFEERFEKRIFAELRELTRQLAAQGCEIWAVSSTNNWVVEVGAEKFGIPAERVLAATVVIEAECASGRLLRVPTDELKATAIQEVIARPVDAVFGNSMHDFAMLEIAREAYAVNPNPDLEREATVRGWNIYWPDATGR